MKRCIADGPFETPEGAKNRLKVWLTSSQKYGLE